MIRGISCLSPDWPSLRKGLFEILFFEGSRYIPRGTSCDGKTIHSYLPAPQLGAIFVQSHSREICGSDQVSLPFSVCDTSQDDRSVRSRGSRVRGYVIWR